MPPIGTDTYSRAIFFDLQTTTDEWKQDDAWSDGEAWSAWQPHSVKVLPSSDGYEDAFVVESIHVASHPCPVVTGKHLYGDHARSQLTMGLLDDTNPDCVVGKEPDTKTMFDINTACAPGGMPILPEEVLQPPNFEPKCMVVLLTYESRKEAFDDLMQKGRNVNHPFRIEINFTVASAADPNLNATSVSCALSRVVEDNYARDLELQTEMSELAEKRAELAKANELVTWWKNTVARLPGTALYPKPPPPPYYGIQPPPAPPATPSYPAKIEALQEDADALQLRVNDLDAIVMNCNPSYTETCGRTAAMAPNPWLAANGQKCLGHDTKETLEGHLCGFWDSNVNLDGAAEDEYDELFEAGPWCISAEDGTSLLTCAVTADRSARSGTYELQEFMREDRSYCESSFFRTRQANNTAVFDAQLCRAQMAERNRTCMINQCSQCIYSCVLPWLEASVGISRCTFGRSNIGQQAPAHSFAPTLGTPY